MSRVLTLACAALAAMLVAQPPAAGAGATASRVALTTSPARVSTRLGDTFAVDSTLRNASAASPLHGLVAHLNIVSLTRGVYVDPEDWSDQRTQYIAPIAAGQSTDLRWKVKAVNGGDFAVYVVVLPGRSAEAAGRRLTVSPATAVHVTERRTLSAGGALPVVLLVPGLLALMTLGIRRRRRRPALH